jgi:two-component system nitrate/nitrite sensor histidine kinase NarX
VIAFALVMFYFLGRAQREVVRQNRELAAVNAIHEAVDGARPLDETLERALDTLLETTGAVAAAAVVEIPGEGVERLSRVSPSSAPALAAQLLLDSGIVDAATSPPSGTGPADTPSGGSQPGSRPAGAYPASVTVMPLTTGVTELGHVRLLFADGRRDRPVLSDETLASIGGQVATAIELNKSVADLERREREARALYRAALRLSSQAQLGDMLDAIVGDARDLLGSERAVVCLSMQGASGPRAGGWTDRLAMLPGGTICNFPHPPTTSPGHAANPRCPLHTWEARISWMAVPLRTAGEPFGELCVSRTSGPFTAWERELLTALADLASIAVSTSRMRDTEEQWVILRERDRIAREMHDSMAQVLGVINMRLRLMQSQLEQGDSRRISAEVAELAELASESYRDVREAILGLRESIATEEGLLGTLREYLQKYSRQSGIEATLAYDGDTFPPLPPASEVQVLRVIQEALTNVRKHAGASRAVVRIEARDGATVISIEDDGSGFDPTRIQDVLEGGFGLQAMRERVEQISGTLEIHSEPGTGTRVVVRLPAPTRPEGLPEDASVAARPDPSG